MTITATQPHRIYLAGRWVDSPDVLAIDNPADPQTPVGATYNATAEQVEQAVQGAVAAFEEMRVLPAYERARALREISAGIKSRREELGRIMSLEAGKPIRDALVEVDRAVFTFRLAAEEAERMIGEVIPLDLMASSKGRVGITRRFPAGPVLGISPFNFPLNLAAHKIAPAIAAGCSILLKPASKDPLTMLTVTEIIDSVGLPAGAVSVLPMTRELGDKLVADDRFKVLSFTGSPAVGWRMKERAGKKKVVLELGGNAAVIIDRTADVDWAVKRIVVGGFGYAGQSCISVQRIFIHEAIAEAVRDKLVAGVRALKSGDPLDPTTDVGPMVEAGAAARTADWVPANAQVCRNEVFAPLVVLATFSDFDDAIRRVNDSDFGLQSGVFTNDLAHAWQAFNELEVGGVVINDISSYRIDHMPYGGVKDSGLSREGLRWSIEDMTELRLMVFAQPQ
jgi:acyl-CoA reductase-like NAD-dependent aldehyde dehydrogenase